MMIYELIKNNSHKEIEKKQDRKLQKVMVYRFVHQMKTPLSVLRLICENHKEDDFRKIERNINTLQYNLNQMLDVYRLEDFKNDFVSEKILLNQVCKDSINALKDYFITSQIYPKLDIDEGIYVYSDSKWLKLVIHQLLTNAIKYSNEGQTVSIKVKRIDKEIQLSIIDYGIGIEKADLNHIFDLFYIGKNGRNNADSSGIGLYIVKRVIDYLGHQLLIKSEVNKGTEVSIKF
ncbi:sensor histidine kinase [Streptococcus agalactiae]|nr:sensor histidine kinase [Streptococcus agalactiae]